MSHNDAFSVLAPGEYFRHGIPFHCRHSDRISGGHGGVCAETFGGGGVSFYDRRTQADVGQS